MTSSGAHLDLACDDIAAEVRRLPALGAVDVGPGDGWHALRDPVVGPAVLRDQPAALS